MPHYGKFQGAATTSCGTASALGSIPGICCKIKENWDAGNRDFGKLSDGVCCALFQEDGSIVVMSIKARLQYKPQHLQVIVYDI